MQSASFNLFLLISLTLLINTSFYPAISDGVPGFQKSAPVRLMWSVIGEDVELPCDITPPIPGDSVSMILWFKDSDGIPLYSVDARKGDLRNAVHWAVSDVLGKKTYFQIADGHRAKLKINNIELNDQGMFRCRVDFVNSPTRNFRVNLTLIEQPSTPIIYDGRGVEVKGVGGPFLEGYDLLLTCLVSGGIPKPMVTWWKDGHLLDGVMDTPKIDGQVSKFTVNQLYIVKVTKSLWGSKLECRAQSGKIGKTIIKEVPLDIYLKPTSVKIFFSEDPISAGREFTVRCETWGSSPAAIIIWKLGGHVIRGSNHLTTQRSNSTVSKIALVLGKEDNEKELICRAENPRFPGGILEEKKIVRVLYPPVAVAHTSTGYSLNVLKEGDDLKITCDVQSNPPPISIVWFQNNKTVLHDVSSGILVSSNTLTLRNLTLSQVGHYHCQVTNAVGKATSPPLFIHIKFVPRCKEGFKKVDITAVQGETLKLQCQIEAEPVDDVKFAWTFNSTRGDILPIQVSRIIPQKDGLISTLDYKLDSFSDFGTLACWAINSVGRQKSPCIFNITLPNLPQPPTDCSLYNKLNTLEVNCFPGSENDVTESFLLELRGAQNNVGTLPTPQILQTPQSDQGFVEEVLPLYQERNLRPNFLLHDLEPKTTYTISVYAENQQGRSKPYLFRNIRLTELMNNTFSDKGIFIKELKSVLQTNNSDNLPYVVALIGISILAVVIVGMVISLTYCRKIQREPTTREGPDDFTTPSYVGTQKVDRRIRYGTEKRRSQRTSLYSEDSRNGTNFQLSQFTELQLSDFTSQDHSDEETQIEEDS